MQVEASMLSSEMLISRTFHLICIPSRCVRLVSDILSRRESLMEDLPELRETLEKPIFVWEPMEGSCRPSELLSFYEALKFVDVFSPNEHELKLLFHGPTDDENQSLTMECIHEHCQTLLTLGFSNNASAVVVRRGASGCVIASHGDFLSVPAYHQTPTKGTSKEIALWEEHKAQYWDVTGGGNAFLGGFCISLLSRQDDQVVGRRCAKYELAAIYGSVAASFAIEQIGLPRLTYRQDDGVELWNGEGK